MRRHSQQSTQLNDCSVQSSTARACRSRQDSIRSADAATDYAPRAAFTLFSFHTMPAAIALPHHCLLSCRRHFLRRVPASADATPFTLDDAMRRVRDSASSACARAQQRAMPSAPLTAQTRERVSRRRQHIIARRYHFR
jgi:hypothetical protein